MACAIDPIDHFHRQTEHHLPHASVEAVYRQADRREVGVSEATVSRPATTRVELA